MQKFDVDTNYFTSNSSVGVGVGGAGGEAFFCGVQEGKGPSSGIIVRSIKAWYNTKLNIMRGIEIGLTDGSQSTFGNPKNVHDGDSETDTFYFDDGELITSVQMWSIKPPVDNNYRMGRLEFKTNKDRSFDMPIHSDGDPYKPEVGSGLLVGIFGRHGEDIDCLGLALLQPIKSAQITNIEYQDIAKGLPLSAIKPKEIMRISYDNTKGTEQQTFTFVGSETVEESQNWSVTAGIQSTISVQVSGGVPLFSKVSESASLTVSVSGTYERSTKTTKEQSFNFPVTAPAGKYVTATTTVYEGEINIKYTGIVVILLSTGKAFQYDISGTYTGLSAVTIGLTADSSESFNLEGIML